jgi:hypothetical protein
MRGEVGSGRRLALNKANSGKVRVAPVTLLRNEKLVLESSTSIESRDRACRAYVFIINDF